MSQTIRGLATVMGRILLGTIFLMSALGHDIPNFKQTTEMMESAGVPYPPVMLAGAIVFLIAGSLSVILGYKAHFGAALLFVFLILATYYFHAFWKEAGEAQQNQMINFMKNVALMGAMLFIMANGSGPMSLDKRPPRSMPTSG
jgi:putative oxidoreductase